jgi:hypothetical protein
MVRPGTEVDVRDAIDAHLQRGFPGQRVVVQHWNRGAIAEATPDVRVLRVDPETRGGLWLHVTAGGWSGTPDRPYGYEFVLVTPFKTPRAFELLALVVYFHRGEPLKIGDTVLIGEPWLPGSACNSMLLSAPYLLADELWKLPVGDRELKFLWTIPITPGERDFVAEHGLDALEQRFEAAGLEYWDPHRSSVV